MAHHPIPTVGVDADDAAADYEAELRRAYGQAELAPDRPLFDVCLLGLGDDGHTASLIPGEPAPRRANGPPAHSNNYGERRLANSTHFLPRICMTDPNLY